MNAERLTHVDDRGAARLVDVSVLEGPFAAGADRDG